MLLTACGAATTPRVQPTTTVERTAVKAPLTPICAFYSTLIAVGLTVMKPDKAKLTVPLLREHWPELVAAAKRGQDVRWEPALEPRMRPAYARFLTDIDETDAAVAAGDVPRFMRALHGAGESLRPVDALSRKSKLACKVSDGQGGTMSIGSTS